MDRYFERTCNWSNYQEIYLHFTLLLYLHFLQNGLPERLKDVSLATFRSMWFEHYVRSIFWLLRSPDLKLLDFFTGVA